MRMLGEGDVLTALYFEGTREMPAAPAWPEREVPAFLKTRRWLDAYFAGREPPWRPRWRMEGLTPFRREVVEALLSIPFGATATYGGIAALIAKKRGMPRMSAQAVGGAVGWNPVCLVVPCHRVVGAGGALTGYGGGMDNKRALLAHEGHREWAVPAPGTPRRPPLSP